MKKVFEWFLGLFDKYECTNLEKLYFVSKREDVWVASFKVTRFGRLLKEFELYSTCMSGCSDGWFTKDGMSASSKSSKLAAAKYKAFR